MNTYIKSHFLISKTAFLDRYGSKNLWDDDIILEETDFNYNVFSVFFIKVGAPWSWTERPKYYNLRERYEELSSDEATRFFIFKKLGAPIGYALISKFSEDSTVLNFKPDFGKIIEIENFGFFPTYTGKRYGERILERLFRTLFLDYDLIYLSSRSTNHNKVVPFYKRMGMVLMLQEVLTDDLIHSSREKRILM